MSYRWFLLSLMFLACAAAAQQPAPASPSPAIGPAASPSTMTFDVQVTDKSGHPVLGLQQSDFTLLDNRRPAPILDFRAVDNIAPVVAGAVAVPPLVILVMDNLNASFSAISIEQKQISAFLTQNGGHLQFPVVLLSFSLANLQQIGEKTTDGNALNALLLQHKPELHALTTSGQYQGSQEMQRSIQVLQSLATIEARIPGRKLMLWVSPGWAVMDFVNLQPSPADQRNLFSVVVDLNRRLRAGGVTLYGVDPEGTHDSGGPGTLLWTGHLKPVTKPQSVDIADLALPVEAIQSGGQYFTGDNDITGDIEKCVQDADAWYSVTFAPEKSEKPNTWNSIEVEVDRPGVTVRTRDGYYSEP